MRRFAFATGLALAVYGLRPRAFPVAWATYAVSVFIAFLGPGLKLGQWLLDLAPTTHVGNPPVGSTSAIFTSEKFAGVGAAGPVVFDAQAVKVQIKSRMALIFFP